MTKNKILVDYYLPRELLLLLGIDKSEITDYRLGHIYFKRNSREFLVLIDSNYYSEAKDNTSFMTLTLYDTSYYKHTPGYGLNLFTVKNITCDKDFERFRKMLEIQLHEPIQIDCKDEKNEL